MVFRTFTWPRRVKEKTAVISDRCGKRWRKWTDKIKRNKQSTLLMVVFYFFMLVLIILNLSLSETAYRRVVTFFNFICYFIVFELCEYSNIILSIGVKFEGTIKIHKHIKHIITYYYIKSFMVAKKKLTNILYLASLKYVFEFWSV